ncbi:glycine zipper 2TM domain-containing protein [Ramlibacter albus]|uniref:Glycine zipper 2TM domain-containing protein n=1 Tax=Ramlibacter albus TaxID=2079448 RepID=A0A923S5G7_9BURK|nr:glycine zipper 2TM domain-containing protein [Ramlibacter albus]MBC5768516.1 glycine zipper 2TM domain-containing protein [Ramlibacter albus]
MKETFLIALLATAGIAAQAQAPVQMQPLVQPAPNSFVDRARVQHVEPQYETVQVPREECGSQWVTQQQPATVQQGGTNVGGAIIGGVAGAIVGNQVGKGHGREAATAAGAVVGALAGNSIANRNSATTTAPATYEQREVRTCRTVMDTQQRTNGYRVTYIYNGNAYTTVMREQPGNTIPVRVSVTPEPEYYRR